MWPCVKSKLMNPAACMFYRLFERTLCYIFPQSKEVDVQSPRYAYYQIENKREINTHIH